jgi:HD-like signal output (HDOD) protein
MWRRILGYPDAAAQPRRGVLSPMVPRLAAAAAPAGSGDVSDTASITQIEYRFHRYVLGLPEHHDIQPTAEEVQITRRLQAISTRFDVRSLPRLPSVLPQLLRSLKSEHVGGAQLAQMIGRDPILVGEVMRVSRSIYYRTLHPIQSLQHAVVLLGQDGLRRVVTAHLMKPIMHASAGMFGHVAGQRLWDHAERCAHACAFLGKGHTDSFEAYLAGIVCNTGTGAVIRALDQEFPTAPGPLTHQFLAGCSQMAAELSVKAARHWDLPPQVIEALEERAVPAAVAEPSPLGKALLCANPLAMAQVLGEQGLIAIDTDLSQAWPERFNPALVARCQADLRRQFNDGAMAAG